MYVSVYRCTLHVCVYIHVKETMMAGCKNKDSIYV